VSTEHKNHLIQKVIIILRSKDEIVNKKFKNTHQNNPMVKFEWFDG
jgi:hypothetical protein